MQPTTRNILILAAVGVILVGVSVVLLTQPEPVAAPQACGKYTLTATGPLSLDGGVEVSLGGKANELRFDSATIAETGLTSAANTQVLAAINAMPVNLRAHGSLLTFKRCGDASVPIHLESPAPDAGLDAYAWDGQAWTWLSGSTDRLSVDLPDLPQAVIWVESLPNAPAIGTAPDPQSGGLAPEFNGVITELYAPGLQVMANGSLSGTVPLAPEAGASYVMYPVVGYVTPGDTAAVQSMLGDDVARTAHIDALLKLATGSNFAGTAIDYGDLAPQWRNPYASLIDDLAAALHAKGKRLVVVLPAPSASGDASYGNTGGYDWARIGRAADAVQVELPLEVTAYQAGDEVVSLLKWAATQIERSKIQPIVSAASERSVNGSTVPISFREAAAALGSAAPATISATVGMPLTFTLNLPAGLKFDAGNGTYGDGLTVSQTEIHTAATLAVKLNALSGLRLRGAMIRGAQGPAVAPNLVEPIKTYRQQTSVSGSGELTTVWSVATVEGSSVLTAARPLADAGRAWTWAADREGRFTVSFSIDSEKRDIARVTVGKGVTTTAGSCYDAAYLADVTVPDGTRLDNNKDFTKTWKVRNAGTCAWSADTELAFVSGAQLGAPKSVKVGALDVGKDIQISVPMKTSDNSGSFSGMWQLRNKAGAFGTNLSVVIGVGNDVVVAPPPAAGGKTEFGIHAHYYGYVDGSYGAKNIVSYVTELGLGWVKIQFRWGDYDYYCGGSDLDRLATMVDAANAAGLKVLLSVVTTPPCKHPWTSDVNAPPDDPNEFAKAMSVLAGFFKGRIQAMEVWNEANISSEWKTSPQAIDANRYTQLLAVSYAAIKAQDPNILVISGALAPTGWNDGVNAVDDFVYLQQMVAAGATKYMDCVGVHVNALRVPPSAALGGSYDSLFSPPHHSWYFKDTVLGYQSITGKPACVTEFGIATPEAVGSVPGFEWAAGNSMTKQADWTAEGMSLCKQWGCRLLILWNLDYGPVTRQVDANALYSLFNLRWGKRPVYDAIKNWCTTNGCK